MSHRVLFVDDEGSVLNAITRNLNFELDITTAYSAEEALVLLNGPGRFDVVVTDIKMPGIDGMEFARQASVVAPGTPFIVLSGCEDQETLQRAAEIPAVSRVLTKPAGLRQVIRAIENAVKSSGRAASRTC